MTIRQQFIDGMRLVASTVNVVTTDGDGGRAGVTVSAMTPVSADGDAPTLLVCVHHLSAAAGAVIRNGRFCSNLLRDDQSHISEVFAGRIKLDGDKFSCTEWEQTTNGSPRVKDPLAAFDCILKSERRVGTHYVFIGEVQEVYLAPYGRPLTYANRAYGSSVQIWQYPAAITPHARRLGGLDALAPVLLPPLMRKLQSSEEETELYEGDQRYLSDLLRAGTIDFALLCDFQLGDDLQIEAAAKVAPTVLLPEAHPLAAKDSLTLPELLPEPWVMLDAPPSADYFMSLFNQAGGGTPKIATRARTPETIRGMVAQGLGYGLLPIAPPPQPGTTARPLSGIPPLTIALCRRRTNNKSAEDKNFITACADLLQEFEQEN